MIIWEVKDTEQDKWQVRKKEYLGEGGIIHINSVVRSSFIVRKTDVKNIRCTIKYYEGKQEKKI